MKSTKTILLIDWPGTNWPPGVYTKHSCLEPYGLECVGALAKDHGYKIKIFQFRHNSLSRVMDSVKRHSPFAVGVSVKTYNLASCLLLAKAIKSWKRSIYVIFGGEHPSLCPDIVTEKQVDYAVRGEGELAFLDLLYALESNGDITRVNNIAFRKNGNLFINPQKRILNLDELPFALRNSGILKDCKQFGFAYPSISQQKSVAQINYSRGCPYNCSFCASPKVWNRLVIYRNPDKIIEEIFILKDKYETNLVFFADLTFNLNKEKAKELCRKIITSRVKINWFCMCRPQKIDNGLLQLMKEAGCSKIGWGIESLNEISLSNIKPGQQNRIEEIGEVLNLSHSLGIINRAYLMIGYPWEGIKDIEKTFSSVKRIPIDELKVSFFTPFPGTPAYQRYRKSLITDDMNRYTTDEPIIRATNIHSQKLIKIRKEVVKEFYRSKEYQKRLKEKIKKYRYLEQPYKDFIGFLKTRAII